MSGTAERIKELLGSGLSNEVVANAVGVTPSYISQLMADTEFSAEVVAKRTQTLTGATVRDRSWDGIEDRLLEKLSSNVDNGLIYKTTDLLRALSVVNGAKRRGAQQNGSITMNKTVVTLTMPTVVLHNYKKNHNGEVIEVSNENGETKTLVTMPAMALMRKLTEQHQGNKDYDEVRNFLPASTVDAGNE